MIPRTRGFRYGCIIAFCCCLIAALAILLVPFLTPVPTMTKPSTPMTPPSASTTGTTTAYPGGRWEPPPVGYAASATHDTSIALADGTQLAATVAYPVDTQSGARAAGPFPFIVELTPYLRLGQPVGVMPYFVERGYIHAVVRPRGTGGSTGQMQQFTWEPLFCDGPKPPHFATFSAVRVFGTLPLYFSAWVRAYT